MDDKEMIMRKIHLLLAVFLLAGWAPDAFQDRNWSESQLLTRAAPTLATEGFDLTRVIGFTVTARPGSMVAGICAVSTTATFSGTGQIDLVFRDATIGWYMGDPTTSLVMSSSIYSGKTSCSKTFDVLTPRGRALPVANAITISSGNCVRLDVLASVSGKSSTM
jgi:hypothetical protein